MDIILTICCKEKDKSDGLTPAINRYLSQRISTVNEIAASCGKEFFILSGKFGVIHSLTPIPWYDKRLDEQDVKEISKLVIFQLQSYDIKSIEFYGRSRDTEGWGAYFKTLDNACGELKIQLKEFIL